MSAMRPFSVRKKGAESAEIVLAIDGQKLLIADEQNALHWVLVSGVELAAVYFGVDDLPWSGVFVRKAE